MNTSTQSVGTLIPASEQPQSTVNSTFKEGLDVDLFLPHYLPPAGRVTRPAIHPEAGSEPSWLVGLPRQSRSPRIGKKHLLAGWEMAELLDDRGEVIVVLPVCQLDEADLPQADNR